MIQKRGDYHEINRDRQSHLKDFGHPDRDIAQIEEAITKTTYKIDYEKEISAEEASKLLGRKTFLSGISRSTFHWTASREIGNIGHVVAFDSSKLFI